MIGGDARDGGFINLNWKAQVFEGDTPLLVLMRSVMLGAYPYGVWPLVVRQRIDNWVFWVAQPPSYFQGGPHERQFR